MSLGIGLGAFAGGFKQGYGMGKQIKTDMNERKTQKEITNAYESSQKNFQEGVAAGQLDPNTWDKYANEHFYPQIVSVYEKAGDFKTAGALREHLKSQKAIEHGRIFGNGLFQYNMGDYHGLANTANQIMKNNGLEGYHAKFLENGLYRVTMPGPDGKESAQDMSPENFFSNYYNQKLNPEAAALYQISQRDKNIAKAQGIASGNGGEADDKPTMNFDAAFKQARELAPPDASLDEIKGIAYKIQEASRPSSYQRSTTGITGGQVLVDQRTGRPVGAPAAGQGGNAGNADAPKPPAGMVRQDLPPTHQVEKGKPLPDPRQETPQQFVQRTEEDNYLGMKPLTQQATPAKAERHMPYGMRDVGTGVPDPEPHHIPQKERPIPANKPPSREQLFQKWQERKPANNKEQAAYQDEKAILQMMGERENPEKILKAVAAKFPYHKRKLMSPEFKELVDGYTKGFALDPKMGWQVKKTVGLGIPFPKANPKRKNAIIPDL